jgi:hypothetical protein
MQELAPAAGVSYPAIELRIEEVPDLSLIQTRSEALTEEPTYRCFGRAGLRAEVPLLIERLLQAIAELLAEFGEFGLGGRLGRRVTWSDVAGWVSSHTSS